MSRSCQSAHVLEPDDRALARTTRASPQIRSATTGFRLCGIAEEPFCPGANGSSTSRTSVARGAGSRVANRSSDDAASASAASSSACRSRWIDLRRDRVGLEPEPLARDPLDLGSIAAYVPTAPESLPTRIASSARASARAVAVELECPARELQPEGRRLGVHAVRAADGERLAVLLGARDDRLERAVEPVEDELARVADLERERGVDDVRRRQPVVEPAPLRRRAARRPRRRMRPCRGGSSRSISATRSGVGACARSRIAARSAGTTPSSAQPSSAASSTSSQRSSLPSSDQILAMAGRE